MDYLVSMYTWVGFSGAYIKDLEAADSLIENISGVYYYKITDAEGNVIREVERPFFVRRGTLMTDNYNGEKFWSPLCFASQAEAKAACPGQPIIELRGRCAYLDI